FLQRFDSSLALHWHVHALVPDGVFVRPADPTARPRFHRLAPPTDDNVLELLRRIARKIRDLLRHRGLDDDDASPDPDDLHAQLQLASSRPLQRGPRAEPAPPPPLCARLEGSPYTPPSRSTSTIVKAS